MLANKTINFNCFLRWSTLVITVIISIMCPSLLHTTDVYRWIQSLQLSVLFGASHHCVLVLLAPSLCSQLWLQHTGSVHRLLCRQHSATALWAPAAGSWELAAGRAPAVAAAGNKIKTRETTSAETNSYFPRKGFPPLCVHICVIICTLLLLWLVTLWCQKSV